MSNLDKQIKNLVENPVENNTKNPAPKSIATADLCDKFETNIHAGVIRILPPVWQNYGKKPAFYGQAVTIKTFEDNSLVKTILEKENGKDKVLIIDGAASLRCALLGGNLAKAGATNAWQGIIVNGCVRDSKEINEFAIGVRALATNPLRSLKKGLGERDLPVNIQGVVIKCGDWVYADEDGIVISSNPLH